MTFLEYLLTDLIGEPIRSRGNGESYWLCPVCDSPKFHTMPHKAQFRDRALCWHCGFRGDAADMTQEFFPDEPWTDRQARIDAAHERYKAGRANDLHPPGAAGMEKAKDGYLKFKYGDNYDPHVDEFDAPADAAVLDLLQDFKKNSPGEFELVAPFKIAERALEVCADRGLHPLAFAGRCQAEAWFRELDREHLAGCHDPNCEAAVCRRARGWTEDEIRADIARSKKIKRPKGRGKGARLFRQ